MNDTRAQSTALFSPNTRKTVKLSSIGWTALTYVIAFLVFFPVLWMVVTGFKSESAAVELPPKILFNATLDNFRTAWGQGNYPGFFSNSVILSVGSTLLALLLGVPAAYSLGLFPTKRAPKVLSWVLSTKMMPLVGVIVPFIVIYKQIGLYDTHTGVILMYAAMNLPLVIWMMCSFFAEVPREIIEASGIDGANFLRTLISVVLPLAAPGLAATSLLCLIFTWNEFFFAVNLTGPNAGPLSVYISGFMTGEGLFWAKMSAASTMAIAPVFVAGWVAQRWLVRGLTMGAVK
jgi:sorbitol/mannitol transport system permease protein